MVIIPLIGKSRLNRRLHAILVFFWHYIVSYLSSKHNPGRTRFLVDSFPLSVCRSVRSSRRSLFQGKKYVGYNAGKKMWFTPLAVSMHDLTALQKMYFQTFPRSSTMFGDKAYISWTFEQKLLALPRYSLGS